MKRSIFLILLLTTAAYSQQETLHGLVCLSSSGARFGKAGPYEMGVQPGPVRVTVDSLGFKKAQPELEAVGIGRRNEDHVSIQIKMK
jgi:hypothetical protein